MNNHVIQINQDQEVTNGFTSNQIEIIKNVVAKGLTPDEFKMFLYVCKRYQLDPIAKQIYAVKRKSKSGGASLCIQTGIDGLRLIAERTGNYAPGSPTQFEYDEKKNLVSATAFVKKYSNNSWHEISATAMLKEYRGGEYSLWATMPHVMLEKCAEARALRRAFPGDLSGLYSTEEMDQAEEKEIDECISEEQVEELKCLSDMVPDKIEDMLKYCGVSSMEQIKQSQFPTCIKVLRKYIEEKEQEAI